MIKKEKEELLADIRIIFKEETREIRRILDMHTETIAGLMVDITAIKEDLVIVKADIAILKDDIAILKDDVAVLKNDVTAIKNILEEKANKKDLVALGRRVSHLER